MKLHTKLTLSLLLGLLLVVTTAQVYQYVGVTSRIQKLSETDLKTLQERESEAARNICTSVGRAVAGSLERGEMQKFTRLLEEQKKVRGLIEFSLFDRNGVATHSSDPSGKGKTLPDHLKGRLLSEHAQVEEWTDDTIRIFKPQLITADCVRCHTTWKAGQVGGVTYFAFSTAALAQAQKQAQATLATTKRDLSWNGLGTILGVVAVLVAMVYLLVRRFIGRPLGLFTSLLQKFETDEGDLTRRVPITTKDEIGGLARLFNSFIGNLERVVGKSKKTADAVGHGATAQASTVEETTASMKGLAGEIKRSAEHAQEAQSLIRSANQGIAESHRSMKSLTTAMDEISQSSGQIVKIVKLIDEISMKTNLLALNAAVEAARAGQAGAGFAVVAADVRKLSKQSAESASNIASLIDATIGRIQSGKEMVDKTREMFDQAADRSQQATELVERIARLAQEQAKEIEQVNKALGNMDQTTQQSAVQARELMSTMSAFRTADDEAQADASAHAI